MLSELMEENGAIINDKLIVYKSSYRIKHGDKITLYVPYEYLVESYHRRIMQLFVTTFRKSSNDDGNQGTDSKRHTNNTIDSDDNDNNSDSEEREDKSIAKKPPLPLEAYDIAFETDQIDRKLKQDKKDKKDKKDTNVPSLEEEIAIAMNADGNEHLREAEKVPRILTHQHVYEWLELMASQMQPCPHIHTPLQVFHRNDIILYEDDHIVVVNKPPNVCVHSSFETGIFFFFFLLLFLFFFFLMTHMWYVYMRARVYVYPLLEMQEDAIRLFKQRDFTHESIANQYPNPLHLFMRSHTHNGPLINDDDDNEEQEGQTTRINPLDDILKPGIVHRLDKRTSGLMVICKNKAIMEKLREQFREHSIDREYLALVHSHLPKPTLTIRNYIERHPNYKTRYRVMPQINRRERSVLKLDDIKQDDIIRTKLGRMTYEQEMQLQELEEEIYV
ncbi:Ribosomal large subunit pseudouridine synthase D [Reticulomyxa filosa]|uniref:Ribosomal large subunit pseudouridine synthase D n=1 Tax=Reticulomyxa filosa TaxID=46433 RepID=X6NNV0_RETFI|nr:Ribosomal large subunit pseudouridine synthase D [Reticulomyxa filosa]|eukprot:ETO27696.1 Ribosomal large subunit pseudouridine synthase D [Reticulomyxa filosa]